MNAKYFLIVLFSFLSFSCSKQLDVEPVSTITNASFWKTEDDANGALTGMYVKFRNLAVLNLFILGEARSEVMEWGTLSGTLDYDRYYLNTLNATSAGPNWQGIYANVNAANLIIKYVPNIQFNSEANKNYVLAQAYAMRAYLYFVLARTWGDVPLWSEPVEGYSAETTQKTKTPVADIFDFIKTDLEKSIELFPNLSFPDGKNRWNKASAYALKADVYLWTGKRLNGGDADFNIAVSACEEVEKADVGLLENFPDIFKYNNKQNKEILMSVGFKELEGAANNYFYNMYSGINAGTLDPVTGELIGTTSGGVVWTVTELVRNQFSADDTRKDASFLELPNPTYYPPVIVKGRGVLISGVRYYTSDIIIYRFADVLLMKAEAKNALGQDPSTEMNKIRLRAYGPNYSAHEFVDGSKEDNDEAILKERLLELVFEGKRWWDLVRFDKAFDLVPSLAGKDSYMLLWPIPLETLSLEPNVTQNPGY